MPPANGLELNMSPLMHTTPLHCLHRCLTHVIHEHQLGGRVRERRDRSKRVRKVRRGATGDFTRLVRVLIVCILILVLQPNPVPHPYLLGGRKGGGNAMSPLHSQGSPTKGNKIRIGCLTLPSRGPKRGRKCHVTLAFSGIPNKGEQIQNWLPHPCLLGGPKEDGNSTKPLHSRGSPRRGTKMAHVGPVQKGP